MILFQLQDYIQMYRSKTERMIRSYAPTLSLISIFTSVTFLKCIFVPLSVF